MPARISAAATALAVLVPAPLLAHGGHEAAGGGLLHALVHLLPVLAPALLAVGAAAGLAVFVRRRAAAR